jgi:predicted kinase
MTKPDFPARTTLHFLCGKAGAGKSTVARDLAAGERAILLCEDVWLARLYGEEMKTFDDYRRFAQRLRTVVGPFAIDLLRARCNVVLDFPANTRAARAWFRALADEAGAAHVLHFVDSPDATCLERIGERNVERPEGSHHLSPEQFAAISASFEPPGAGEGLVLRRHPPQVG